MPGGLSTSSNHEYVKPIGRLRLCTLYVRLPVKIAELVSYWRRRGLACVARTAGCGLQAPILQNSCLSCVSTLTQASD